MSTHAPEAPTARSVVFALVLAFALVALAHAAFGNVDLNLRDEGYLWYGVTRVLAGEVPLRDFQAYDPGRYYWCAALSRVFGDGIVGLRASVAVFEALGLAAGLLVARRIFRSAPRPDLWMLPCGLVLLLWMFPRHKLFEHGIAFLAVLVAVRLLERPSARRFLVSGLFVGAAAFFGRNHGLYLSVAFVLVTVLALRGRAPHERTPLPRAMSSAALGVVLGYAPLLLMLAFVPGFAASFSDAVFSVAERGANIAKDYPWPWTVTHSTASAFGLAVQIALDVAFLMPPVVLAFGVLLALHGGRYLPLIAATCVGLPYVHHYAVCSDLPHLAQAFAPILLGALALTCSSGPTWKRASMLALFVLVSGLAAFEGFTPLKAMRPDAPEAERTRLVVAGDELDLKLVHAATLDRVQRLAQKYIGADDEVFIAPTMPTFYAVLGKRSPTWWIYFLWPASDAEQAVTIERLRDVDWVLLTLKPFDDDPEYGFERTNPLVWKHLTEAWSVVDDALVPPNCVFLRRSSSPR